MATILETIQRPAAASPLTYTLAELGFVDLQSVFAHFDGTAASGSFRPALTIRAQNGTILARVFPSDTLAAGDTADVTYAPFLGRGTSTTPAGTADGWEDDSTTAWTYASGSGGGAATFTRAGNFTATMHKGVYVRLKQGGGYKYFVVTGSSFAAGTTTVSIMAGTSYTLANAAITDNGYSFAANPTGWPHLFAWAAAPTGFSSLSTNVAFFSVTGDRCDVLFDFTGTSNATTFTFDLPIATLGGNAMVQPCFITDNGATSVNPGLVNNSAAGTTCQIYRTLTLLGWTNSGTKRALANGFYYF